MIANHVACRAVASFILLAVLAPLAASQGASTSIRFGEDSAAKPVTFRSRICATAADCNNRGTCSNGVCDCEYGYAGLRCHKLCRGASTNSTGHVTAVCSGHGTCLERLSGRCTCSAGYTGSDCATAVPEPEQLSSPQTSTNTSAITVTLSPPSNQNSGGSFLYTGTEYEVEYCKASDGCDTSQSQAVQARLSVPLLSSQRARTASSSNWKSAGIFSTTTVTISGLEEGSQYQIRARARFRSGEFGNYSEPVSASTTARDPDYETVTPIVNGSVTANSILVQFVPPRDIGGGPVHAKIVEYRAEYRKAGETAFQSVDYTVQDGSPDQATVSGLDVYSTYEIRQSARNVAGWGDPSPIVSQKTRGVCGNSVIEAGSLGNGLAYTEVCDGGHCCENDCTLKPASHCSNHGTCSNGTTCTCSTGYEGDTCASCADTYYESGSSCVACGCSADGSSSQVCTKSGPSAGTCACNAGYSGTKCTSCLDGYYPSGSQCLVCHSSCATCNGGSSSSCLTCANDRVKFGSECPSSCPTGYVEQNGVCINARSCYDIKQATGTTTSGLYTIDPDGSGPTTGFQVYCEMSANGGGWTLMVSQTSLFTNNMKNSYGTIPQANSGGRTAANSGVQQYFMQNDWRAYGSQVWVVNTANQEHTYSLADFTGPIVIDGPNYVDASDSQNRGVLYGNNFPVWYHYQVGQACSSANCRKSAPSAGGYTYGMAIIFDWNSSDASTSTSDNAHFGGTSQIETSWARRGAVAYIRGSPVVS